MVKKRQEVQKNIDEYVLEHCKWKVACKISQFTEPIKECAIWIGSPEFLLEVKAWLTNNNKPYATKDEAEKAFEKRYSSSYVFRQFYGYAREQAVAEQKWRQSL